MVDSCSELEASLSTVANVSSSGLPLGDSGSELEALPVPSSLSGSVTKKISLFLVSPWFFLVLPVLFFISHRIALLFLWVLLVHLAADVSSSHKDQTLASNVIEESRKFDAIVQLIDSAKGSSVVSSGAQFVSAVGRC